MDSTRPIKEQLIQWILHNQSMDSLHNVCHMASQWTAHRMHYFCVCCQNCLRFESPVHFYFVKLKGLCQTANQEAIRLFILAVAKNCKRRPQETFYISSAVYDGSAIKLKHQCLLFWHNGHVLCMDKSNIFKCKYFTWSWGLGKGSKNIVPKDAKFYFC